MKYFKANKVVQDITASLARQLIEVKTTVTVAAGSSHFFSTAINYEVFDIRTVYATTDTGDPLTVSLYDSPAADNEIYRSLTQPTVNDIVAIPCRDKSGAKNLYIRINNATSTAFNANILIKIVNL